MDTKMSWSKEFRIGNLVYAPHLKGSTVVLSDFIHAIYDHGIVLDYNWHTFIYPHMIKPLELSEYWFRRFGFEKEGDCYILEAYGHKFRAVWSRRNRETGECTAWYIKGYHNEIRYVHQLQNLYFIVTGDELKYDSNTDTE